MKGLVMAELFIGISGWSYAEWAGKFYPAEIPKNRWLEQILQSRPKELRYCFEFRHTSWFCKEVYDLLRQHNAALCIADSPKFPLVIQRTADFSYFRLHGAPILYRSRYSSQELKTWAERVQRYLDEGADVYVYFDNTDGGHATTNALELVSLLSHRDELRVPHTSPKYPVQGQLPFC